jgi:ABC-type Fe3+ transport system permease subunit
LLLLLLLVVMLLLLLGLLTILFNTVDGLKDLGSLQESGMSFQQQQLLPIADSSLFFGFSASKLFLLLLLLFPDIRRRLRNSLLAATIKISALLPLFTDNI